MRAVVLVVLVACYGPPDYAGTMFKCDDQHPCPDGQACIAGVCGGSLGNGFDGVKCGAGGVCTAGQVCCAIPVGAGTFHCIPTGGSCQGGLVGSCDGIEDCAAGQRCCFANNSTSCGPATCADPVCTDSSDCPSDMPSCTMIDPQVEPWGRCF